MTRALVSSTAIAVFALFAGGLAACVESHNHFRRATCAERSSLRAEHYGWRHGWWDDHDEDDFIRDCMGDASSAYPDATAEPGGAHPDATAAAEDASTPDGGAPADTGTGTSTVGPDAGALPPDSGPAPDSGVPPDSGVACMTTATCPAGSQCASGVCEPCVGGVCTCRRDTDCSNEEICNHNNGTCELAPPTCVMLTVEADCVARADCRPIYAGMNCTNAQGTTCQSGEANCTCATYSFAACVDR
jgi:hypothetical protein